MRPSIRVIPFGASPLGLMDFAIGPRLNLVYLLETLIIAPERAANQNSALMGVE